MARGELLRKLFASYARHDDHDFRAVALQIIAEEQQKQNHSLARDLLNILDNTVPTNPMVPLKPTTDILPRDKERELPLVDIRKPLRSLSDILLKKKPREQLQRILEEYRKAELLRVHGLRPKTKLLFCGPPGCGKSLCAEIISSEVQAPLLYIRFDAIISSYLGETAANLRKVFDYANTGRWVVVFDEFDAIGKSRTDATEHGELKRVVNSFLQLLDGFEGESLIIAATNHEKLLDKALWRRFDEVLLFSRPTCSEARVLLNMKLKNFPQQGLNLNKASKQLAGFSHADIEWVCLDAVKSAIVQDRDAVTQDLLDTAISRQKDRIQLGNSGR
jgi:SpoVK/Ycf46/Vps4 family AAA+-type ATPase